MTPASPRASNCGSLRVVPKEAAMRRLIPLLALAGCLGLAVPASASDYSDAVLRLTENQPAEVTDFVVRRIECNHWRAEDTAGGARLREINAELGALRCERADADEAALRRRYAGDRNVGWALDEVRDMLF
jgi:hypothetical protein